MSKTFNNMEMCSFQLFRIKSCQFADNRTKLKLSYSGCITVISPRVNTMICSHFGDTTTAIRDRGMLRPLNNFMLSSSVIKSGRMLSARHCSTLNYILSTIDVYFTLYTILYRCIFYTKQYIFHTIYTYYKLYTLCYIL